MKMQSMRRGRQSNSTPALVSTLCSSRHHFQKLARLDEARAAVARVLELQPSFRISKQFNSVGCTPDLTALLTDALTKAGLPLGCHVADASLSISPTMRWGS